MPTKKEEKPIVTPFTNPEFRGRSVSFGDIEFQRKFEQLLIRYGLRSAGQITAEIAKSAESSPSLSPISSEPTENQSDGCNWTKNGATLVYLGGNVGIGVSVPEEKLDIDGNVDITGAYKVNGASLASSIKIDELAAADDNTLLNVSITAHGLMSKLPNDAMQLYTGTGTWAVLAEATGLIQVFSVASATARNANATQKSTTSSSYVKLKETALGGPTKGVRIKFTLWTSNASYPAYGRIYKNGVAIGTEQSSTDLFGEVFEQDFTAEWAQNDLIQVYVHRSGSATAYVSDLQFCYDRAIASFGSWHLVSYLPTVEQTAYGMTNQDP